MLEAEGKGPGVMQDPSASPRRSAASCPPMNTNAQGQARLDPLRAGPGGEGTKDSRPPAG